MKKSLLRLLALTLTILLFMPAQAEERQDSCRSRVAVVLSGGGAKGMAHIGVLRVIERAGIPVDIITGTSMGALIGGLYSIGYDAATLDSLVKVQDWKTLLSDKVDVSNQSLAERDKQNTYILSRPLSITRKARNAAGGLITGINLSQLFTRLTVGYHDSIDFNDLPIPFACVATNIVDNTEYDFHNGVLSNALRASMAIPGVFTPVRQDSMVLVDGGLRNNYPADIAKRMGADIIIGVSVQSDNRTAAELKSGPDILMQIVDINCKNKFDENWDMTDIPIKVNVKGYSSASFTRAAIDTLIARGEEAAMQHWDELKALKRKLDEEGLIYKPRKTRPVPTSAELFIKIDSVCFDNIVASDRNYIVSKYKLGKGDSISVKRIEEAITTLGVNFLYTGAGYTINKSGNGYILKISAKSKRTSRINLGVRFDTEEMVALQANMSHQIKARIPVILELTGRLGKRMMARLDAQINPLHYGKIGLSYVFRHDDTNIYQRGQRDYNFTYNQHSVNLQLLSFNIRNFSVDMNVKMDFYDFHDMLSGPTSEYETLDNMHFYSYIFRLNYNSEDRWFFTTRGARFNAGYGYYTDNFIGRGDRAGLSIADFMWRMSFPLNSRFVIQPMVSGRLLFGNDIPLIMRNSIGGQLPGMYLEQQVPFAGIGHIEFVDNMLVVGQIMAQQRIMDNNYIIGRLSFGQRGEKLRDLFKLGPMTGCEIAYYYNSMFGPVGASLGYSSRTNEPYFYINLGFQF